MSRRRGPLLALMDAAAEAEGAPVAACRHTRTTTSPTHEPVAEGRACNHAETCDACGALVGVESWNLSLGAAAHARAYPAEVAP